MSKLKIHINRQIVCNCEGPVLSMPEAGHQLMCPICFAEECYKKECKDMRYLCGWYCLLVTTLCNIPIMRINRRHFSLRKMYDCPKQLHFFLPYKYIELWNCVPLFVWTIREFSHICDHPEKYGTAKNL